MDAIASYIETQHARFNAELHALLSLPTVVAMGGLSLRRRSLCATAWSSVAHRCN